METFDSKNDRKSFFIKVENNGVRQGHMKLADVYHQSDGETVQHQLHMMRHRRPGPILCLGHSGLADGQR